MVFCSSCGNEETSEKNFCSRCGTKLLSTPASKEPEKIFKAPNERSGMWYLAPILFGIIGGIVAYFIIRNDAPKMARNCLIIGFASFIGTVIIIAAFDLAF